MDISEVRIKTTRSKEHRVIPADGAMVEKHRQNIYLEFYITLSDYPDTVGTKGSDGKMVYNVEKQEMPSASNEIQVSVSMTPADAETLKTRLEKKLNEIKQAP